MEYIGELLAGILSDIQSHPSIGYIIAGGGGIIGIRIEFIGNDRIGRQVNADALSLSLFQQLSGCVQSVVFTKGIPDLASLGLHKRIRHTAADDDIGSPFHQVFYDEYFIGHLSSADYCAERPLPLLHSFFPTSYPS